MGLNAPLATPAPVTQADAPVAAKKGPAKGPVKVDFLTTEAARPHLGEEKKRVVKNDAGENVTRMFARLKEAPTSWDVLIHKPLRKVNFEEGYKYLLFQADLSDARSKKLREDAEEERLDSATGIKAKKKRLTGLKAQIAKLLEDIGDDPDIDKDALLKDAGFDPASFHNEG